MSNKRDKSTLVRIFDGRLGFKASCDFDSSKNVTLMKWEGVRHCLSFKRMTICGSNFEKDEFTIRCLRGKFTMSQLYQLLEILEQAKF